MNTIYSRQPFSIIDNIPVFCSQDRYTQNYDAIAEDHLREYVRTGNNPFMAPDYCTELDNSTETFLRRYLPRSQAAHPFLILDVGVGMGNLLGRFSDFERYGADISLSYLRYARERGVEVCLAKIEDLPYGSNIFDVCVCTDVLEHVLDLNRALESIVRVVKPGGLIVIRVPYKEDLSYYVEDCPYEYVHLRSFDENSLFLLFNRIFDLEVLGFSFTGFEGRRYRFVDFLNIFARVFFFSLKLLQLAFPKASKKLLVALFLPCEINIAIRNVHRGTRPPHI